MTSAPPSVPATLHVLIENMNAAQGSHMATFSIRLVRFGCQVTLAQPKPTREQPYSAESTGMDGGSGVLPKPSSSMH